MTVCYWCGAKDTLADIGKELDDGKYKMVKCSKCKNAYYVLNKEKVNEQKQMTNEEYLRSCTTEQLAEWLGDKLDYCQIMWYWECDKCTWSKKHESCMNDKEKWLEWLKQPHREE